MPEHANRIITMKIQPTLRSSLLTAIFFTLSLALGLLYPGLVHAQPIQKQNRQTQNISIESVNVDIWPEYDRPSVLVIYHVSLSPNVSLPAELSMRIPIAAGKPFAVAWQSPDKALFDLNYDTKTAGDWTEIEFKTPAPDFRIEYYDPSLKKAGNRRDFTFHWDQSYSIQNLTLLIQQPASATRMTFQPAIGSGAPGDFGLTYYTLPVGKVSAGKSFDLAFSYDKPNDTLTNPQQFQSAQPNQPVNSGTSGRVTLDQLLPWGLGGLGFLLIAVGFIWYWRTGRGPSAGRSAGRLRHIRLKTGDKVKAVAASTNTAEAAFCHQCGKKAAPGDIFCRSCGTKLR